MHAFTILRYDHLGDNSTNMDNWENINLAHVSEHKGVIASLRAQLEAFFKSDRVA
jgi:hypothetical protein